MELARTVQSALTMKKLKEKNKRLVLKSEKLRLLQSNELQNVDGGAPCTTSGGICLLSLVRLTD